MTTPPSASMTRSGSGRRARTSVEVPSAAIRLPSIATAPSKTTSWSSLSVTTIALSISSIAASRVESGWHHHPVEHVSERYVCLVQHLALVDRRELVVAVHDLAVDDRRVDGAAVRGKDEMREQVRLRLGEQRREHLIVEIDQDDVGLLACGELAGLMLQ